MAEQEHVEPSVAPGGPAASGDPRVDAAVEALESLDDVPVHDHPTVFEDVHRNLQEILAREQE